MILHAVTSPMTANPAETGSNGGSMAEGNPDALTMLEKADEIFQSLDYQGALLLYVQAAEAARSEFNRSVEVEALSQAARMNLLLDQKEDGRKWLAQAESRAGDDDPMGWSRFLGVRGRFEWKDGDLEAARQTFNDMYVYCNTNSLWPRAVDAAHMIAIVSEDPEEQVRWGKIGIEAAEKTGNESWLGPLWNNLASTYFDLRQFDSALGCYLKARDYHWRFSGETAKLFADYHVGMTFRLLGNLDEAARWLRPVLAWAERLDNHAVIGQACEDLGEVDIADGRVNEGLEFLRRARDEYKKERYDETWPEVWQHINERIRALES
jgi:tetratricopeptide (TPR) repeat protein